MKKHLAWILVLAAACTGEGGAIDGGRADAAATDASAPADAAARDAVAADAVAADAAPDDAAAPDAVAADAEPEDSGPPDAGAADAGFFSQAGCEYDGSNHGYGERFPSTDGCNECTCAASGLACTRRVCPNGLEEGAILLEDLDAPCGPATFTPRSVIDGLPHPYVDQPFLYDRARALYPETLPDTRARVTVVYDAGFLVCRIPSPGQEALDIEILLHWATADGAFDEHFQAYLRRNASGFVDAWDVLASAPLDLLGTYNPACLDPGDFTFSAHYDADGSAEGVVTKICETDIALDVGRWTIAP